MSNFTLLHVDIPLSQYHLLKGLFFLPLNYLSTFVGNKFVMNVRVYFCTLNPIPLIYMSILMPLPHCLDYCSFVISFQTRKYESFNFVLLFQDCFCHFQSISITLSCWEHILPACLVPDWNVFFSPSSNARLFIPFACKHVACLPKLSLMVINTKNSWKSRTGWKTGVFKRKWQI